MDIRAKNSITDRVQFTGKILMDDQAWVRDGFDNVKPAAQPEGSEPGHQSPVTYMGPERRERRDRQELARSA
jgi:hypothetical protein